MYKFLTALLVIFCVWGIAQHRKEINAYEREIADLEYTIRTGEHCINTCVDVWEKMGC